MYLENNKTLKYRLLKASRGGQPVFINMADINAVEAARNRCGNKDLLMSACHYTAPEPSAPRIYPLRFHVVSPDLEQARTGTLEACYYINERFSIPADCLEIVYTGGGNVTNDVAIDANGTDRNSRKTGYIDRDNNSNGNHHGNSSNYNTGDSYNLNIGSNPITEAGNDGTPLAEMIILIPPIVFSGHLTI